jgi:hypothetical protein
VWIYELSGGSCAYDKTPPEIQFKKILDPTCTTIDFFAMESFFECLDNCTPSGSLIVTYKDSINKIVQEME